MKGISILGSTGSIGRSALDVIAANPSHFRVAGLTAYRNIALLAEQIKRFRPSAAAVVAEPEAEQLLEMLGSSTPTKILWGTEGYNEVATLRSVQMVISAMVGAAGLLPTIAAIDAGKDIALANKETLVMAGSIVVEKARAKDVALLPVDSEHSAIFQCIRGHETKNLHRIILTASGGPFLHRTVEDLGAVTVEEALKHPNWKMGPKITIDSATMMNKGLEIIEAMWLFSVDVDKIDVVIHPQSIIHSMVEYVDGSIIAQLGVPDMRVPISYALSYPERLFSEHHRLNICEVGKLDFLAPDRGKFMSLNLAYQAARAGGTAPAVLNASNEMAVSAFISGVISFLDIVHVVRDTLEKHLPRIPRNTGDILEADRWARGEAGKIVERIKENR